MKRPRRRRRTIAAGSAVAAAAAAGAITVAVVSSGGPSRAVTTGPPLSPPASVVTLPPAPSVAGATPYDYRRLRLWLPGGWTTSTSGCHSAARVVYFPAGYVGGRGGNCPPDGTDIVVVAPYSATPPGPSSTTTVDGMTVDVGRDRHGYTTWYVPTLGVELALSGGGAQKVADTLGPSPLQDLLTAGFPTPVPTGWRTVTFDGFHARVPATWPTHRIVVRTTGDTTEVSDLPGVCAPPTFRAPSLYVGAQPRVSCPSIPQTRQPGTEDGLWLQPTTNTAPLASQLQGGGPGAPGPTQRLLTVGSEQVLVTAGSGDTVDVGIDTAGRRISAVIGLGANPAVAEAVLSSIRPAGG